MATKNRLKIVKESNSSLVKIMVQERIFFTLKIELGCLKEMGVISQVDEPTDWTLELWLSIRPMEDCVFVSSLSN